MGTSLIVKYMLRGGGGGDEMSHYEIGGNLEGYISETFNKNFITSACGKKFTFAIFTKAIYS